MSGIIECQTNAAIHVFKSLEGGAKLARHFVDVIEEIGGSVLIRERCPSGMVLLALYCSL